MIVKEKYLDWVLFGSLCLIWGSSFLLMKIGLRSLGPYEVASLRILSAGMVLMPRLQKALVEIPRDKQLLNVVSGIIGSLLPAYLFCMAETKLDSALTGMLNSFTPLFAVLLGAVFLKAKTDVRKLIGIALGLGGLYFLVAPEGGLRFDHPFEVALILLATLCYAINVNLVAVAFKGISPINIATLSFSSLVPFCSVVLWRTGFFDRPFNRDLLLSVGASCFLGMVGTAVANVLFYRLVARAGGLFASMVTYGMPFVAAGWGLLYGESVTLLQTACLSVILSGVYLTKPIRKQS